MYIATTMTANTGWRQMDVAMIQCNKKSLTSLIGATEEKGEGIVTMHNEI
jgi:hypothetical protein